MLRTLATGIALFVTTAAQVHAEESATIDVGAPVGLAIFALLFLVFKPRAKK